MLIGKKARNHPQQLARRGADDATDDRRTPLDFWRPLHIRHQFTIDAAASIDNALLPRFWTINDDALAQSWRGERVWCNPPYSDIATWVAKACWEAENGCPLIVMLAPANRTEQAWWQNYVEPRRDDTHFTGPTLTTQFLRGRMRFDRPGWTKPAKGDRPPFGLVLLTWERQ